MFVLASGSHWGYHVENPFDIKSGLSTMKYRMGVLQIPPQWFNLVARQHYKSRDFQCLK